MSSGSCSLADGVQTVVSLSDGVWTVTVEDGPLIVEPGMGGKEWRFVFACEILEWTRSR